MNFYIKYTLTGIGMLVAGTLLVVAFLKMDKAASYRMSNDQIIVETKKCVDAGLEASTVRSGLTLAIQDIQCSPIMK